MCEIPLVDAWNIAVNRNMFQVAPHSECGWEVSGGVAMTVGPGIGAALSRVEIRNTGVKPS